jgi:hypothetical protein
MENGGNYVQNLFAKIVGVIEIVGDMCRSGFLFHFAEVLAVVVEELVNFLYWRIEPRAFPTKQAL